MHAITTAAHHPSRRWLIATLTVAALAALWFIAQRALPYFNVSPDHFGPYFWPRRWGLVLHIAGGVLALMVGVVQLWLGLSGRVARLHRTLGRVYGLGILAGSAGGFYLSLTIPGNLPYAAGLFFLCVAWTVTTAMALLAIRRRDVAQHREWMLRSYVMTFAFVTFRFGVDGLMAWQSVPLEAAQITMAWASWAVPLVLLEPAIQARRGRSRAPGLT